MAEFTAKDVQSLRQRTGVGMMDCKNALSEANGDMEKAIEILREKGIAKAAKKAGRIAAEGLVVSKVCGDVGVVVEVNSETDFVAKNKDFASFVDAIAETILKNDPKNLEELKSLKISGGDLTVEKALQEKVLSIGENIQIRRFAKMNGVLSSYVHGGGTIGVMVKFETDLGDRDEFKEYAKNIAMQIAAVSPQYLNSSQIPSEILDKEKNILKKQIVDSGKPDNIAAKIVEGRIKKFYKEVCLVDQQYVKDNNLTISQYTDNIASELGGKISIVEFIRMEKGEGIEKRSENFAQEIANMVK